jgi:hypothetical protein
VARSSSKKPGDPKCRGSRAAIEGRDWVRVGGNKWLREVAEQAGKFIPREYRKEAVEKKNKAAAAAAAAAAAPAAEDSAAEETVEVAS